MLSTSPPPAKDRQRDHLAQAKIETHTCTLHTTALLPPSLCRTENRKCCCINISIPIQPTKYLCLVDIRNIMTIEFWVVSSQRIAGPWSNGLVGPLSACHSLNRLIRFSSRRAAMQCRCASRLHLRPWRCRVISRMEEPSTSSSGRSMDTWSLE